MTNLDLLSAFLIGVAGTAHCIGMCGGIASAFSYAIPKQSNAVTYHLAYNIGRISSYTIAGFIAGHVGSLGEARLDSEIPILQTISAVFLLLMGLYIGQWYTGLRHLESLGGRLWKHLSPIGKRLIPFKNPIYAYTYGGIWGWLPCGLVYSALVWSMSSGGGLQGASVMLMFGLGTLPALLAAGIGADIIKQTMKNKLFRQSVAISLIITAIYLLLKIYQSTN